METGYEDTQGAERAPRGSRLRRAAVTVAALALPLAALAWIAGVRLVERERERVDSRLTAGLRAAGSELAFATSVADTEARRLAGTLDVQRAVIEGDRAAVRRLARSSPGSSCTPVAGASRTR